LSLSFANTNNLGLFDNEKYEMKLSVVLRNECIVADAQLSSKAEVLQAVARVAKKSHILDNISEQEILDGLKRREALGSTGFGKGVAIPHCRLKSVSDFVVGVITVPTGVDFEALDKEKVKLIVFIVAPEAESNKHIRILSAISQTLLSSGAIDEILAQKTPEGICESFLRHAISEITAKEEPGKNLLHVFVQDEEVFRDILQLLAGLHAGSLVVVNAENAGAYLAKIPLFAEFWTDKPSRFSKVIIAVVEKALINETIRRIESITGHLNKTEGVMVTVQAISYSAGSLSAQL
jgi:PTS system nitrogen regulatory IIA component